MSLRSSPRPLLRLALALAVPLAAAAPLALAPRVARAACSSVPECSLRLGLGALDPKMASLLAAPAFAALAAGATLVTLREGRELPPLTGVIETVDERGRKHHALRLVPLPEDAVAPSPASERAVARPSGALQFNDIATTAVIAAGGAALLTSVIVGMLKK